MSADLNACAAAVPLLERLRSVPEDAVLRIDTPNAIGCMDTRSIPVGRICHEAAELLRAASGRAESKPGIEGGRMSATLNEAIEAGWQAAIDCFTEHGAAGWSADREKYLKAAASAVCRPSGAANCYASLKPALLDAVDAAAQSVGPEGVRAFFAGYVDDDPLTRHMRLSEEIGGVYDDDAAGVNTPDGEPK